MTNWNQEFRLKIIALTLAPIWWSQYAYVIKPEFFENDSEITTIKSITAFYDKYQRPPQLDELEIFIAKLELKPNQITETIELARVVYSGLSVWDLDFARDEVLEFARLQALKIAMLEAIDDIEEGNVEGIDRSISKALQVGQPPSKGLHLRQDIDTWLQHLATEEKIPTGMYHCDLMLDGGASRGEIGVIIAAPNHGKSMSLVNVGFGAASLHSQCNVAHLTYEINPEKLAKRYAARITYEWMKKQNIQEYKEKFEKQAARLLYNDIHIEGAAPGTMSVGDIRNYLDRLAREGFNTDCLIIDSADDMKLPRGDNSYERHGENYRLLRQLSIDYNIAIWTASQTNKMSLHKLTVDLDDMAESFQKAMKADIVAAWCQTPEEGDDNTMRFFCAKNRDGLKHWYVRCKVHHQAHALTSQEVIWGSDLLREQTDKRKNKHA